MWCCEHVASLQVGTQCTGLTHLCVSRLSLLISVAACVGVSLVCVCLSLCVCLCGNVCRDAMRRSYTILFVCRLCVFVPVAVCVGVRLVCVFSSLWLCVSVCTGSGFMRLCVCLWLWFPGVECVRARIERSCRVIVFVRHNIYILERSVMYLYLYVNICTYILYVNIHIYIRIYV